MMTQSGLSDSLPLSAKTSRHLRPCRLDRLEESLGSEAMQKVHKAAAHVAGMSRRTFMRAFSAEAGMSFGHSRQQARLFAALEMLARRKSVTEAAIAGGFCGCLVPLQSCCACNPTLHCLCVYQARRLELKLTLREHREIGNAADVVLCCQAREPFRIDLHHNGTPGEVSGGLCHMRCRHTARSAPGSSEVRQNRNLALANDFVEQLLTSMGSPIAGNCALQAPHLPTSERCLARMRLDLPQEGQFRITFRTSSARKPRINWGF